MGSMNLEGGGGIGVVVTVSLLLLLLVSLLLAGMMTTMVEASLERHPSQNQRIRTATWKMTLMIKIVVVAATRHLVLDHHLVDPGVVQSIPIPPIRRVVLDQGQDRGRHQPPLQDVTIESIVVMVEDIVVEAGVGVEIEIIGGDHPMVRGGATTIIVVGEVETTQ